MSDTLLITVGDSWTGFDGSPAYSNFRIWPTLLANKLGCDLENLGKGGCSNEFIFNQAVPAIIQAKTSYEKVIVYAGWTEARRIHFWNYPKKYMDWFRPQVITDGSADIFNSNLLGRQLTRDLKEFFDHTTMLWHAPRKKEKIEFLRHIVSNSFRQIYMLDYFCKMLDVPIIHWKSLDFSYSLSAIFDDCISYGHISEEVRNEVMNGYIPFRSECENITNVAYGNNPVEMYDALGKFIKHYSNEFVSDEDQHPNEEGMKRIYDWMYEAYITHCTHHSTKSFDFIYE